MKPLAPFISCYIESSDEIVEGKTPIQSAIDQGYVQIYFTAMDPVNKTLSHYVHHVLRPGRDGKHRFVQMKVDKIPGIETVKANQAVEFLPDGKIPLRLLDEIKEFFSQVIKKKGTNLEAMIWILWNEQDGYHLHVPDQTVGGASATYDWGSLPTGSSIIVDIHSHANFGAFFSGTDDRDDTNCIRFSGVIGHNVKPAAERDMKFRFTYFGTRFDVKVEDIFFEQSREVSVPEEWIDKVNTHATTRVNSSSNHRGYAPNSNGSAVTSYGGKVHAGGYFPSGMAGPIHGRQRVIAGVDDVDQESELSAAAEAYFDGVANRAGQGGAGKQSKKDRKNQALHQKDLDLGQVTSESASSKGNATKGGAQSGAPFCQGQYQSTANAPLNRQHTTNGVDEEEDSELNAVFASRVVRAENVMDAEEALYQDTPDFDAIAINHGIEAALAANAIDTSMVKLAMADDALAERVSDMFCLVNDDKKLELFRKIYSSLPSKAQETLSHNGL